MRTVLCTFLVVFYIVGTHAQNVIFADSAFKAVLVADTRFINTNGDSEISFSEAQNVYGIYVDNKGISDLTGIEAFINAEEIFVEGNNVTELNLSALGKIKNLRCFNNKLTQLILPSNNTPYLEIYAQNNQLTNITLPNNVTDVDLSNNQLTNITLPNSVTDVDLSNNQLMNVNITRNIKNINLSNNQLTSSIDLSLLGSIVRNIDLSHNDINDVIFPDTGEIANFDCSHNELRKIKLLTPLKIYYLDCSNNPLDSLWTRESGNTLRCDSSQLIYLNMFNRYEKMYCNNNRLTALPISANYIDCSHNNIKELYSTNSNLKYLDCSHNNLSRLSVKLTTRHNVFPLDATNNPDLECIETDGANVTNAQANWTLDTQTTVSDDCHSVWSSIYTLPSLSETLLYPNPTTGNVQLHLGEMCEEITVTVYDNLGQEVNSMLFQQREQLGFTLPNMKGIYLVRVQTEKGQITLKVVKE